MSSVYVVCWIFLQTFQTYFCIQVNSVYPDQENLHLKMSSVYVVCWIFLQTFQTYFCIQANSVYPDQENLHLKMSSVYVVCWIFLQTFQTYFCIQANSVYPDQTAPKGSPQTYVAWSFNAIFLHNFSLTVTSWAKVSWHSNVIITNLSLYRVSV